LTFPILADNGFKMTQEQLDQIKNQWRFKTHTLGKEWVLTEEQVQQVVALFEEREELESTVFHLENPWGP
jgi:hypothetical protein